MLEVERGNVGGGEGQRVLSIFNQLCVACDNMKHFPAAYVATDRMRRRRGLPTMSMGMNYY